MDSEIVNREISWHINAQRIKELSSERILMNITNIMSEFQNLVLKKGDQHFDNKYNLLKPIFRDDNLLCPTNASDNNNVADVER